ncbi:adenylate/guanylate cyclase domain-containing protein [Silvimonas sp. JCM 19000]
MIKKYGLQLLAGLLTLLVLLAHLVGSLPLPALDRLDAYLYDTRIRLGATSEPDSRVAIIDIDEKSLAALGHWPWRRDMVARLLDQSFNRYKVRALGFDVVFAEEDNSGGLPALQRLANRELKDVPEFKDTLSRIAPQLDGDGRLARALKNRPVALGFYYSNGDDAVNAGALPPPALPADALAPVQGLLLQGAHYGGNLAELQQAAAGGGHFVPQVDADGVIRRVPLLVQINNQFYPSLALQLVRLAQGNPALEPVIEAGGGVPQLEALRLGNTRLAVDAHGQATVPYRGPAHSYTYVSAVDVVRGRVPRELLANRIVVVGATAPGLNDLRVTPVGETYPGVEVHANMISALLDGDLPQRPGYLLGGELLLLIVLTPLLTWLLATFTPLMATLTTSLLLLALVLADLALWRFAYVDMPFANTLVLVLVLYVINMAYGYFFVTRRQSQLRELFGQYVVPELVERMSDDPRAYTMAGQARELSVLFTDVRHFTAISEGMPADELARFMNAFLTTISTVIRSRHLGTIDKYIGDCVMAFWGAPLPDANHAHNAVLAALDIQRAIAAANPEWQERGWPRLAVGVGVNTGVVTVGDMGSSYRMTYTVMGDAVNLASRVEGLTAHYGVPVIVTDATRQAAPDLVYRELDRVRVKGREDPVTLYEPLGPASDPALQARAEQFAQVLRDYRAQHWQIAAAQLELLAAAEPDCGLYRVYLQRIAAWQQLPPAAAWSAIHEFDTK